MRVFCEFVLFSVQQNSPFRNHSTSLGLGLPCSVCVIVCMVSINVTKAVTSNIVIGFLYNRACTRRKNQSRDSHVSILIKMVAESRN